MAHEDKHDPTVSALIVVMHLSERQHDLMDEEVLDQEALKETTLKRDDVIAVLRAGLKATVPEENHADIFLDLYDDQGRLLET